MSSAYRIPVLCSSCQEKSFGHDGGLISLMKELSYLLSALLVLSLGHTTESCDDSCKSWDI